jgi:hypothetical protein
VHHKITHAMVGIVAGTFLIAAAIFGLLTLLDQPDAAAAQVARQAVVPSIAHPVNAPMSDCASCHAVGPGGMPANHSTYGQNTCLTCHAVATEEELAALEAARQELAAQEGTGQQPSASVASAIPHPVAEAYANCVACHAIGGNRGMPENHASYTNEMCVNCHAAVTGDGAADEQGATAAAAGLVRLFLMTSTGSS